MDFTLLILFIFGCIVFIQIAYYLVVFGAFTFAKKNQVNKDKFLKSVPVSVIVCAKNEVENIKNNLPFIIDQNYNAPFEIVLVNDSSYDKTLEIMESFAALHNNIKVVDVRHIDTSSNWSSKKYALMLGIKAATNNHLIFTDADCKPLSKNWITQVAQKFSSTKTIVLGYGGYDTINGSFINKIVRYETLLTALQYFSWAKMGNPYMGVGRNLAYTKELFFENNGFAEHMKILSGDDDLFVNEAATKQNTAIVTHPDSFTTSIPKKTFSEWIEQKRRHVTTADFYKTKDKITLGLFYISQFLFIVTAIILIAFQFELEIVGALIVLRYIFSFWSISLASKKLNEKNIIAWYPVLEIILLFSHLYIFMTNFFIKPNHWR